MNRFDSFLTDLPGVTSEGELCDLICRLGLYQDKRGLYGKFERFQVRWGGVWQDPLELATFLWNSRNDFKTCNSYLEIGTWTGYSFFIIYNFLRVFSNPAITGKTIDPSMYFMGRTIDPSSCCTLEQIAPYVLPHYQQCTSDEVKGEAYDLVFIDGCHEAPWPLRDFDNVKRHASMVFFHDIDDRWCPDVVSTFKTLSQEYRTKRYIHSNVGNTFGIGLVFVK
jgi:hypothetical protein